MQLATLVKKALPKVAYISNKVYPHHNTDTQQVIKNASALHAAGLSVELIIPVQGKWLFIGQKKLTQKIYQYYHVNPGLKIRQLGGFPASSLNIQKIFHGFIAAFYVALTNKYDLIYTRDKLTALLALLTGKKFIFETYRRLGDEYPKIMTWLAKRVQQSHFLGMVLHSHLAAASMEQAGFSKEKLFVLHNGYDGADMLPVLSKQDARQKLNLADTGRKKYVVYTGNMQKSKCIESLIDIAALVPEATFLLVGGTQEDVERLSGYAALLGADNIILTGHRPIKDVATYMYAADVLIIPPVLAPLEHYGRTVLPFKTFPYLAAGRPILAPDAPDLRELLVHGYNAILVDPDNPVHNAAALRDLLADEPLQQRLSMQALNTARSLTWEERATKLKDWLTKAG